MREGLAVRLGEPFGTLVLTLSDERHGNDDDCGGHVHRPRRMVCWCEHYARDRDDCIEWAGGRLSAARRAALPLTDIQSLRGQMPFCL